MSDLTKIEVSISRQRVEEFVSRSYTDEEWLNLAGQLEVTVEYYTFLELTDLIEESQDPNNE